MQQKTIFATVVVIALVVGIVVWKLHTSAPAPVPVAANSGWKVYQDNADGLSFEYPPALAVDKQVNNGYSMVHITDPQNHALYVSIMVVNDPSQPDTNEMFAGPYPKEIPATSNHSGTIDQKTLNGLQGIEVRGYVSEGHSYNDVFMYKDDHLWEVYLNPVLEGRITAYPEPGTPVPDKDTYEKILASIRISS